MFESTLLENRNGRRLPALIATSVLLQAGLLTWLVLVPMLWPAVLPSVIAKAEVKRVIYHPVKIIQPVQRMVATQTAAVHAPAALTPVLAVAPRASILSHPSFTASEAPTFATVGESMGSTPSGNIFRTPGGTGDGHSPNVTVKPASNGTAFRISSGVSSGLLLTPIRPVYPQIAKAAGISGTVIVSARIGTDGRILGAQIVSGPVMLQSAALDAIKEARYRPYLLNGQPVEVETSFAVNFVRGSA